MKPTLDDYGAFTNARLYEGQAHGCDVIFYERCGACFTQDDDVCTGIKGAAYWHGLALTQCILQDFDALGREVAQGRFAGHGQGMELHGRFVHDFCECAEVAVQDDVLCVISGMGCGFEVGFPEGGGLAQAHAV